MIPTIVRRTTLSSIHSPKMLLKSVYELLSFGQKSGRESTEFRANVELALRVSPRHRNCNNTFWYMGSCSSNELFSEFKGAGFGPLWRIGRRRLFTWR